MIWLRALNEPNVSCNERFYVDKTNGTCKTFTCEGCGFENKNKFITSAKCQRMCVQPNQSHPPIKVSGHRSEIHRVIKPKICIGIHRLFRETKFSFGFGLYKTRKSSNSNENIKLSETIRMIILQIAQPPTPSVVINASILFH